jgi:hypothetical protein
MAFPITGSGGGNGGTRSVEPAPAHGPPIRFRHRCGEIVSPVVACPEPITLDDVTALPGPGGRAAPGTRLLGTRVG